MRAIAELEFQAPAEFAVPRFDPKFKFCKLKCLLNLTMSFPGFYPFPAMC